MRYKLDDDDKTLAHNSADMPKDPKKALKVILDLVCMGVWQKLRKMFFFFFVFTFKSWCL